MNILEISEPPRFDNSIVAYEIHTYNPYSNSFKENDEIRIPINQQDIYILPSASYIYVEGRATVFSQDVAGKKTKKTVKFTNNPILCLFQDIRYEINGVEIDRIKNVGITTTLKSYVALSAGESKAGEVWGWKLDGFEIDSNGIFSALIPLRNVLGFAEDYKKIIINNKHELILTRSNTNLNSVKIDDDDSISIQLEKVQWRIPHIKVSDRERLTLLKYLDKDRPIQIAFRNWDLYEYPLLPKTTKHSWTVKTASQLEKPRYVIFGLQTNRKNVKSKDYSIFDHCKLTNVTLFLNSEYYPYESVNSKFGENKYHILYDMYIKFRQSYYNSPCEPTLDFAKFKEKAPLFVIDCSRQNDALKSGAIDVRLEIESSEDFPEKTSAYCLIINDRLLEYRPLSNIVKKII